MPTISPGEKRWLLSRNRLFHALEPAAREKLAACLVERRFKGGQRIFARGDPGSCLFLVARGEVRLGLAAADGREVLLALLEPGQIFGELALLDGLSRSADADARGACLLLALDRRDLLPVLRRSPEAAVELLELVCHRMRAATARIEATSLLPVPARLARLLLARADLANGSARIAAPPSQADLGRLAGVSRQKVNLHLGRWLADGVLAREGPALVIRERERLASLALMGKDDGGQSA